MDFGFNVDIYADDAHGQWFNGVPVMELSRRRPFAGAGASTTPGAAAPVGTACSFNPGHNGVLPGSATTCRFGSRCS